MSHKCPNSSGPINFLSVQPRLRELRQIKKRVQETPRTITTCIARQERSRNIAQFRAALLKHSSPAGTIDPAMSSSGLSAAASAVLVQSEKMPEDAQTVKG